VWARHQGLGLRAHLGHFLEDGLWHEDMEMGHQLKGRSKPLNEGNSSGVGRPSAEFSGPPPLEGEEGTDEEVEGVGQCG
jgi:hypothetical protein